MIITRTPFRISFMGGGTDFPGFYNENNGAVISTSINKYSFVLTHPSSPCFNHKIKASYAQIETVQQLDDVQHPIIRESLRFMGINEGIEVNHVSDLPGRTGLGTSSAFTVGLLHALHAMSGIRVSQEQLA
nr:kinase [Lentisphaerota bacterium]